MKKTSSVETKKVKSEIKVAAFLETVKRVYSWVSSAYCLAEDQIHLSYFSDYFNVLKQVGHSRGLPGLVAYNKKVRNQVYNFLSGNPLEIEGISVVNGIPVSLGTKLTDMLRGGMRPKQLSLLLTVLSSTRYLSTGTVPSYESITSPSNSDVRYYDKYVRQFWRELGLFRPDPEKLTSAASFVRYHLTTKSGPNGHALYTSIKDLLILPQSLIESIKIVGGAKLALYIDTLLPIAKILDSLLPSRKSAKYYRKVSFFPDSEDKVRVVGVLDYFSQTALRQLHRFLYRVLRKIDQDCTFDQSAFQQKLTARKAKYFYSIDLSNATDRFPIKLIESVLRGYFPTKFVAAWSDIMVGYPFHSNIGEIRYQVGNPMGAYSSWASFALAHHFIMFVACRETGLSWRSAPYVILGDDVVIGDTVLAEAYMKSLARLDVPFSKHKTHSSDKFYEFAKRIIYNNVEITPFPIGGLKNTEKRYNLLLSTLIQLEEKSWVSLRGIPDTIKRFYLSVKRYRRTVSAGLGIKTDISEGITRVMMGKLTAVQGLMSFMRAKNISPFSAKLEVTEEMAKYQYQGAALTLFAEANERIDKGTLSRNPLGQLAVHLVCTLTDPDGPLDLSCSPDAISMIPILQVHGIISQMYIDINKLAVEIDTVRGGDWPMLMKALTCPITDDVYIKRNFDMIPAASAAMSSKLSERIDMLKMWY